MRAVCGAEWGRGVIKMTSRGERSCSSASVRACLGGGDYSGSTVIWVALSSSASALTPLRLTVFLSNSFQSIGSPLTATVAINKTSIFIKKQHSRWGFGAAWCIMTWGILTLWCDTELGSGWECQNTVFFFFGTDRKLEIVFINKKLRKNPDPGTDIPRKNCFIIHHPLRCQKNHVVKWRRLRHFWKMWHLSVFLIVKRQQRYVWDMRDEQAKYRTEPDSLFIGKWSLHFSGGNSLRMNWAAYMNSCE